MRNRFRVPVPGDMAVFRVVQNEKKEKMIEPIELTEGESKRTGKKVTFFKAKFEKDNFVIQGQPKENETVLGTSCFCNVPQEQWYDKKGQQLIGFEVTEVRRSKNSRNSYIVDVVPKFGDVEKDLFSKFHFSVKAEKDYGRECIALALELNPQTVSKMLIQSGLYLTDNQWRNFMDEMITARSMEKHKKVTHGVIGRGIYNGRAFLSNLGTIRSSINGNKDMEDQYQCATEVVQNIIFDMEDDFYDLKKEAEEKATAVISKAKTEEAEEAVVEKEEEEVTTVI